MKKKRNPVADQTPDAAPAAWPAWVLAVGVLGVYALTLCPTVAGGDSGEFLAVAYRLGIAHPPGYPLYTLLGHAASLAPWGSVAARINFLSALCDAAAAFFLARAVSLWSRDLWAGLLAGGLFAFSPLVWRYALVAEVFALNNLLVCVLLYQGVRHAQRPTSRSLVAIAFTFGLALANHHTILFFAVFFGPWALWRTTSRSLLPGARTLALAGLAFGAGLLPYAYLIWAGPRLEIFSWGDPSGWSGFWRHFFRQEYGTLQLGAENLQGRGWASFVAYVQDLPGETLGIGALAAVWGAREFYRRGNRPPGGSGPQSNRDLVAVLGGAYLFYVIVFHALSNLPVEVGVFHEMLTRFWQLPNTLLFAGMGLALAAFSDRARFWTWRPWVTPAATVFLVALQLGLHYRQEDQSQNQVVRDYAVSHLIAVSPHALVITKGDIVTNGIRYLQAVEGMRPDVCNFDQGILGLTWGSGLIRKNCPQIAVPPFGTGSPAQIASSILDANLDRFPTYAGSFVLNDGTRSCGAGLSCWGEGLMYRVLRENQAPDYLAYIQADRQAIAAVDLARLSAAEARDGWAETIARYYRDSRYRVGYSMIQKGLSLGAAPLIDEGVRLLEAITAEWPAVPADAYKVLGFGLRAQASRNANAQAKMVRALKTYLGRPEAAQDPQRAALLALVGQGT